MFDLKGGVGGVKKKKKKKKKKQVLDLNVNLKAN
jgi:hypothetical protein